MNRSFAWQSGNNNSGATQNSEETFWNLKYYSKTVKRMEHGYRLCGDFIDLLQDRIDLERNYATGFQKFAAKWKAHVDNSSEYGSMSKAWSAFVDEAERISEIHDSIRDELEKLCYNMKLWRKDNFHKSAMPNSLPKEVKQLDQKFENAQKQWAKQYKIYLQAKKAYATSRKAKLALEVAKIDEEQNAKWKMKLDQAEVDVENNLQRYESSVTSVLALKDDYMYSMKQIFQEAQDREEERITYFKTTMIQASQILDISEQWRSNTTYKDVKKKLDAIDPDELLLWWCNAHGPNMHFCVPTFDKDGSDSTKGLSTGDDYQDHFQLEASTAHAVNVSLIKDLRWNKKEIVSDDADTNLDYDAGLNPFVTNEDSVDSQIANLQRNDEDLGVALDYDDGRTGWRVKALYDYESKEADELSLLAGDIFEKLDDEDEQGWCRGRKNGRIGYYPANYAVAD